MSADYASARTPLVERAYEIARSGRCRDADEVHGRLVAEGYRPSVYFRRRSLSKDLLRVCREARDEHPPRIAFSEAARRWFAAVFLIEGAPGDGRERRLANQG